MESCFSDDCGAYAVTPVLMAPCYPTKCSEDPPMCYPCLPRCPKRQATYYDDKKFKTPPRILDQDYMESKCGKCSNRKQRISTSPYQHKHSPPPTCPSSKTNCSQPPQNCCPTCYQPCKPVKTKYVMPCYRYEDGRIEHYVPTRSGRLPMSAYRRNGMQDQIHGYKGAIRYLCAGESFHGNCVYTTVEPLRRIYPKVTQEITANQPTVLMNRACEVAAGVRTRRKPFVESSYRADSCNEIHRYHSEDEQGNCCYHFERKKPSCHTTSKSCYPCQPCTSSPECQYIDCVQARAIDSTNCCFYC